MFSHKQRQFVRETASEFHHAVRTNNPGTLERLGLDALDRGFHAVADNIVDALRKLGHTDAAAALEELSNTTPLCDEECREIFGDAGVLDVTVDADEFFDDPEGVIKRFGL